VEILPLPYGEQRGGISVPLTRAGIPADSTSNEHWLFSIKIPPGAAIRVHIKEGIFGESVSRPAPAERLKKQGQIGQKARDRSVAKNL
jgi:hypothetical protein